MNQLNFEDVDEVTVYFDGVRLLILSIQYI